MQITWNTIKTHLHSTITKLTQMKFLVCWLVVICLCVYQCYLQDPAMGERALIDTYKALLDEIVTAFYNLEGQV